MHWYPLFISGLVCNSRLTKSSQLILRNCLAPQFIGLRIIHCVPRSFSDKLSHLIIIEYNVLLWRLTDIVKNAAYITFCELCPNQTTISHSHWWISEYWLCQISGKVTENANLFVYCFITRFIDYFIHTYLLFITYFK